MFTKEEKIILKEAIDAISENYSELSNDDMCPDKEMFTKRYKIIPKIEEKIFGNHHKKLIKRNEILMAIVNKKSKYDDKIFNGYSHHIGYDRNSIENYLMKHYKVQKLIKSNENDFPYFTDGGFKYAGENENWEYEFICHPYNIIK